MRVATAAIVMYLLFVVSPVLGASDPNSAPGSDEIVGILNGKTYSYGELVSKPCVQFNPGACLAPRLRLYAALNFRSLVLSNTLGNSGLNCDLSVSDREIDEFIAWWRSYAATAEQGYLLRRSRSDQITSSNPQAREVATKEIGTWKERACLYRIYGGGHVQIPAISVVDTRAGFFFPRVQPGIPHDAYRAHFQKLMNIGQLQFADGVYQDGFFWLDQGFAFCYYKAQEEADAVLIPYWTKDPPSDQSPRPTPCFPR